MPKGIVDIHHSEHSLLKKVALSAKQASIISNDPDQGFVFNAILDFNGSISLAPDDQVDNKDKLYSGSLRKQSIDKDDFVALLLDPEDLEALIESNVEYIHKGEEKDPLLFAGNNEKTILKLEDVLHKDDSLDELLPPEDDKWYLYGDSTAIDKAISSPLLGEIHDELLMQQLLTQNYTE